MQSYVMDGACSQPQVEPFTGEMGVLLDHLEKEIALTAENRDSVIHASEALNGTLGRPPIQVGPSPGEGVKPFHTAGPVGELLLRVESLTTRLRDQNCIASMHIAEIREATNRLHRE